MKWTRGVVREKVVWADGLFTLRIHAPDVATFEPGQFLQLGVDDENGHIHRPYSVASPHGELLDFFIVLVEDGKLTPRLWEMEVGAEIDVSAKAAGSFTLKHCPGGQALWLLATGTGLAPYIAMLRTEQPWNEYQKIVVAHGVRYARDLAYQEELGSYGRQYKDRFEYIPVISREEISGTLHGRITNCLANGSLEATAGHVVDQESCVMMCGNPAMLNETEQLLGERGIRKHKRKEPGQIVVERYW